VMLEQYVSLQAGPGKAAGREDHPTGSQAIAEPRGPTVKQVGDLVLTEGIGCEQRIGTAGAGGKNTGETPALPEAADVRGLDTEHPLVPLPIGRPTWTVVDRIVAGGREVAPGSGSEGPRPGEILRIPERNDRRCSTCRRC